MLKNFEVEVSTDNKTWTQIGDTEGHKYVNKWDYETYDEYNEYVLYGCVKCRYVKFNAPLRHVWLLLELFMGQEV